jgi:hypothetical protein
LFETDLKKLKTARDLDNVLMPAAPAGTFCLAPFWIDARVYIYTNLQI